MFLPTILEGQVVAIAGPAGPLTDAVAEAASRAGAAVVLCGQDAESLDELAWELARRRDAVVDIVAWDGLDPGAGLRSALAEAGWPSVHLVLSGAAGWSADAAGAWMAETSAAVVLMLPHTGNAQHVPLAGEVALMAPSNADPADVAAWAVFLMTGAGRRVSGQIVRLDTF